MGRPRFGRRHTPPDIRQAQKDTKFPGPEGKEILLSSTEADGAVWKYKEDGSHTNGALRLISVKKLLSSTGPATIELVEWSSLKAWPRDDPTRFGDMLPRQWPRYAAISHVWEPSEDAARFANEANRPLQIDVGGSAPHTISWLGLVQAATAARAQHRVEYLWLDLLCLNQQSHNDKRMQIKQMAKIYRNAAMVIVMPGGVVAAQGFDKPSSWINRAWTFQEATLGWPIYVLVNWSLPGSFSYFSRLKVKCGGGGGGGGGTALARLGSIAMHCPGQSLGVSTLVAQDGTAIREHELDLPLRCLGDDPATVSALASVLEDTNTNDSHDNRDPPSSLYDLDELFTSSDYETDTSDGLVDDPTTFTGHSSQLLRNSDGGHGGPGPGLTFGPRISSSEEDDDSVAGDSGPKLFSSMPNRTEWGLDDDTSSESFQEASPEEKNHGVPSILDGRLGIRYGAVWRSMWLRTSTKPQDLVFSMMHLLDVSIEVDYTRSLEELIFELVEKTQSIPAWLVIGHDIPVRPQSGLIPVLPNFTSNSNPTYCIDGKTRPASEVVCNGEFYCHNFDIDFKNTSMVDGHLICARILDVKSNSDAVVDVSQAHPSFYEVKLHLSCPSGYEVDTKCRFKGQTGSVIVVIGDYSMPTELASFGYSYTPFVYFLDKTENGTWQKTGAGTLDEPLLYLNVLPRIKRRHLNVGGSSPGAELTACDCPNESKDQTENDGNVPVEDLKDLDTALARAAYNGDERRARQLVDLGADVSAHVGSSYGTPILAACSTGNAQIVELFIRHGADVNVPAQIHSVELHWEGVWYGTPLQAACIRNFEPVTRLLIERGGADANAQEGPEGSVLQAAVRHNYNRQIVQLLLDHGADPNAHGGMYGTALMAAQAYDSPSDELVHLLIDHGAEVNFTKGKHITEDGWVCRSALQMACRYGALNRVRFLIARGADVNLRSGGTFDTALQEAAYYGFSLICETLLDNGADVHVQGGHFGSALQAAVAGSGRNFRSSDLYKHIVRMLLEKGADANVEGGYYSNALQAAGQGM